MNTLTGQTITGIACIAICKEPHPLKANAFIYRAYELENDKKRPLYIGRETPEETKAQVRRFLSHKPVIFCEI